MKYFSIFSMLLCISTTTLAGTEMGTVRFEHGQYASNSNSAGYTFFYLDGGVKNSSPACATFTGGERWVINNNWPAAKIQNSILLAAVASGKKVAIRGSGNCEVWGDTETALNLFIAN